MLSIGRNEAPRCLMASKNFKPITQHLYREIRQVIVYKGHEKNPLFGPYSENIEKRIKMFNYLNLYRERHQDKKPWKVIAVPGEELINVSIKNEESRRSALVIPPRTEFTISKVFSIAETTFLKEEFFSKGGRGYFNCGSAYWVSSKRIYTDLCEDQPENQRRIIKTTNLPLFQGKAEGPLCPFPGKKYQVGFFSDAVAVTDGKNECTIFLSGGGSFIPQKSSENGQKVRVLARYLHSELIRNGKRKEECPEWENAAIMISIDKGAAILSMFHPYYGSKDIDVETYERAFPDSGTNWKEVHRRLSPLDVRMQFVFNSMLAKLEGMDF